MKSFGEDKDLEYIISVTELPKIDLKQLENIKANEYEVTIDSKEIDKRINDIAKNQKNFVEVDPAKVANEGDLVTFDYKATVDGNDFKERFLLLIHYGDWLSYWCAILHNTDPSPVKNIQILKDELSII